MPELALQSKKELCFDHDTKNGHTYLESSELHTLGIAIYSLHGKTLLHNMFYTDPDGY